MSVKQKISKGFYLLGILERDSLILLEVMLGRAGAPLSPEARKNLSKQIQSRQICLPNIYQTVILRVSEGEFWLGHEELLVL